MAQALDPATLALLRETGVLAFAGYRVARSLGPLRGRLGVEVGGGVIVQSAGDTRRTGASSSSKM